MVEIETNWRTIAHRIWCTKLCTATLLRWHFGGRTRGGKQLEEPIELIFSADLVQDRELPSFPQRIAKSKQNPSIALSENTNARLYRSGRCGSGLPAQARFFVPVMMLFAFIYGLVTETQSRIPRATKWALAAGIMSIGFVIACLGNEQTDARLLTGEGIMLIGAFIGLLRFTPPKPKKDQE